jgi:alkanesulfonate monooxygenase SsuD/methylene tetrahydromethanopterin reductase-like flavin-dependent oxidoreductase (luciferase family)
VEGAWVPEVDLFLLSGQHAGIDAAQTLCSTVEYARAAERAGLAGVWLAEHHFIRYGTCPSATVLAGHLLAATDRIAVGTAASVLSTRHPVALGEEAALLDALAPGRFRLGVARGGPWVDLEVFGTGLPRFEQGFTESLDLLLRWLSGAERVAGTGELFRFRGVSVVPRPPRPLPVWVAATSESTVETAAKRGLPLLLGMHDDDAAKVAMLRRYQEIAGTNGHLVRPAHVSGHLICLADSADVGRRRLRATLPAWLATTADYVRIDGLAGPRRDLDAYAEKLLRIHPIGPPAECAARLAATVAETGVRRLLLMVEAVGERAAILDQIAALGAELLPLLAKSSG